MTRSWRTCCRYVQPNQDAQEVVEIDSETDTKTPNIAGKALSSAELLDPPRLARESLLLANSPAKALENSPQFIIAPGQRTKPILHGTII